MKTPRKQRDKKKKLVLSRGFEPSTLCQKDEPLLFVPFKIWFTGWQICYIYDLLYLYTYIYTVLTEVGGCRGIRTHKGRFVPANEQVKYSNRNLYLHILTLFVYLQAKYTNCNLHSKQNNSYIALVMSISLLFLNFSQFYLLKGIMADGTWSFGILTKLICNICKHNIYTERNMQIGKRNVRTTTFILYTYLTLFVYLPTKYTNFNFHNKQNYNIKRNYQNYNYRALYCHPIFSIS